MKKFSTLIFTKIMYMLFIIATVISLFIVYKNIDSSIAVKFVIGYLFLIFFFILYVVFVIIFNSRKLKWTGIKNRLFIFIVIFVVFGSLNYGFDYFFRSSKVDLSREFSIAFGSALGISFFDVIFLKRNKG